MFTASQDDYPGQQGFQVMGFENEWLKVKSYWPEGVRSELGLGWFGA
jgi:hypothetical protein